MKLHVFNEVVFSKHHRNVGYVYIGKILGVPSEYKIGRTKNLNQRLVGLKREYGEKFEYVYMSSLLFNCVDCEMRLHDEVGENPIRGLEWFELGDLTLEVLCRSIDWFVMKSIEMFEQEWWENGGNPDDFDYERCY